MIDQIEVERFKLQILNRIQDEELTNATAVIEIPFGSEDIALKAILELEPILEQRKVKTVLVASDSPKNWGLPSMPSDPSEAVAILTIAFALLSDQNAALVGSVQPSTVRYAFTQLARKLYSTMSRDELEKFLSENFPS